MKVIMNTFFGIQFNFVSFFFRGAKDFTPSNELSGATMELKIRESRATCRVVHGNGWSMAPGLWKWRYGGILGGSRSCFFP